MSEMTPRRLSYMARIILVPLGESGHRLVDQMAAAGLTEVQVVTERAPNEVAVRDINADTTTTRRIDELATESDMVILIGSVLPKSPSVSPPRWPNQPASRATCSPAYWSISRTGTASKAPKRWQY